MIKSIVIVQSTLIYIVRRMMVMLIFNMSVSVHLVNGNGGDRLIRSCLTHHTSSCSEPRRRLERLALDKKATETKL